MAARTFLDVIPQAVRPAEIDAAVSEAVELRARLAQANEDLAALQADLDRLEADDVASVAQRIREGGAPPTTVPTTIEKQRRAVEVARRNTLALRAASESAQADALVTLREHAEPWIAQLGEERQRTIEEGLKALDQFARSCAEVGQLASAANWLRSGSESGVFPDTVVRVVDASFAPTSSRASANSSPFQTAQLVAWCHELLVPPPPPNRALGAFTPAAERVDAA
jgi:hypothetical protein